MPVSRWIGCLVLVAGSALGFGQSNLVGVGVDTLSPCIAPADVVAAVLGNSTDKPASGKPVLSACAVANGGTTAWSTPKPVFTREVTTGRLVYPGGARPLYASVPVQPDASQPGHGAAVISKPVPLYTADALSARVEGTVAVRVAVAADGVVKVMRVEHGLGHGLDASAIVAARSTKFRPATDAAGTPTAWEGLLLVRFQLPDESR